MRAVTTLALAAAFLSATHAETLELVLQDGHEGYTGTEDFMMYAPSSVAFVNYGRTSSLASGINRWGEHYCSIVRFDVRSIPAGSKVLGAKLLLYHHSEDFPRRALTVDVHELTAANADWSEGAGDGTRTPTPGAPCWAYRKYDTDEWAGSGGARKPDVDFSTKWVSQAEAAPETTAWLEFALPASAVQRWIDAPKTNAGLHLWPSMAAEKGDIVYLSSSEAEDQEHHPKLVLTLASSARLVSSLNRARATRAISRASERCTEVSGYALPYGPPPETKARLGRVRRALAELARTLAETQTVGDAVLGQVSSQADRHVRELNRIIADLPRDRARHWNETNGLPTDFALGIESPMVKVFRRDAPFEGEFRKTVRISLARNEHEGAQIVIVPVDVDLEGVTWEITGLDGSGLSASVAPVGYVRSVRPHPAKLPDPSHWWPDPLLSFLKSFEVPRREVQPLWLDVYASAEAPAGITRGQLTVRAENAQPKMIGIEVTVFDFAVPVEQHLRTIWGMSESNFGKYYGDDYDEDLAWEYFNLFLDHRLAVADLYRTKPTGEKGADSVYHLASTEALKRLRARGSGWWNVGYVLAPKWALQEARGFGADTYEAYLDTCVEMFREEVARVQAAGWPADRLGIYFLDETSDFEALAKAAEVMKRAFPDIPLMTTGYDRSYGLGDGAVAKWMDIWVPLTPRYHEDRSQIIEGRKLGKQVWWYICVGPRDRGALNWFVQYPAIRARLLMGVAARKYAPDGFLYYRVAGWNNNDEPISDGPYTNWDPHYHQTLPDGDGMLICAGPEGPLSTIRLENIRDGLEDYEYYWLLDDLLAEARARQLSGRAAAIVERAGELQDIPEELLKSIVEYSESPEALLSQREKVARAIERLQRIVEAD